MVIAGKGPVRKTALGTFKRQYALAVSIFRAVLFFHRDYKHR